MLWRPLALLSGLACLLLAAAGMAYYANSLEPLGPAFAVAILILGAMAGVVLASLDAERRARRYAELRRILLDGSHAAIITGLMVVFSLAMLLAMVEFGRPPTALVAGVGLLAGLAVLAMGFRELSSAPRP